MAGVAGNSICCRRIFAPPLRTVCQCQLLASERGWELSRLSLSNVTNEDGNQKNFFLGHPDGVLGMISDPKHIFITTRTWGALLVSSPACVECGAGLFEIRRLVGLDLGWAACMAVVSLREHFNLASLSKMPSERNCVIFNWGWACCTMETK